MNKEPSVEPTEEQVALAAKHGVSREQLRAMRQKSKAQGWSDGSMGDPALLKIPAKKDGAGPGPDDELIEVVEGGMRDRKIYRNRKTGERWSE